MRFDNPYTKPQLSEVTRPKPPPMENDGPLVLASFGLVGLLWLYFTLKFFF
jgi:hypothetical protein